MKARQTFNAIKIRVCLIILLNRYTYGWPLSKTKRFFVVAAAVAAFLLL